MATNARTDRYSPLSIAMHWLMLVLLIAVYACIELRGLYPKGSDARDAMKAWHFMLGLAVFALVFVRMAIRFATRSPSPPAIAWQRHLATVMHGLLYAFLVLMPLLGWLALSADGKPIPFFGLHLPPLVAPDKAFAHSVEEVHETIGTIGYWLVGVHAVAALYHHYLLRDNTLLRMLPARSR
ncbi:MAG: cytochrome b [Dokdonella sp.]|uniref:cytochrome b n=1 Tax=Dokdonella sp. TaxID=2291710 RepID=UPI003F800E28